MLAKWGSIAEKLHDVKVNEKSDFWQHRTRGIPYIRLLALADTIKLVMYNSTYIIG